MKKNDIIKLEVLENTKKEIEKKITAIKKARDEELDKMQSDMIKIYKFDGKLEILNELLGNIESEINWTGKNPEDYII